MSVILCSFAEGAGIRSRNDTDKERGVISIFVCTVVKVTFGSGTVGFVRGSIEIPEWTIVCVRNCSPDNKRGYPLVADDSLARKAVKYRHMLLHDIESLGDGDYLQCFDKLLGQFSTRISDFLLSDGSCGDVSCFVLNRAFSISLSILSDCLEDGDAFFYDGCLMDCDSCAYSCFSLLCCVCGVFYSLHSSLPSLNGVSLLNKARRGQDLGL